MTPAGMARYQEVDVLTMTPARRVLLLYGHLLLNLRQAGAAIAAGEIAARSVRVGKSLDVLNELLFSLDREAGGPIAERLASLYVYLMDEVTLADRERDGGRLERATGLVASLQEAWVSAASTIE